MFNNVNTATDIEESGDVLGGFVVHDSDAYPATIKNAYQITSAKGATGMRFEFVFENGTEYRVDQYMTSRSGDMFYTDDKTGKKRALPGYTVCDDIALFTTGKGILEQNGEEKQVRAYNPETKQEELKAAMVATEMLGQKIILGLLKVERNQTEKVGDSYQPKADGSTREENDLNKIFSADDFATTTEVKQQLPRGDFYQRWLDKNKGQTINRVKKVDGAAQQGRPPAAGGNAGPQRSQSNDMFKRK